MIDWILEFAFPSQCAACGAVGSGLCADCVPLCEPVVRHLPTLRVRALGTYDGAMRRAVLAVKGGRRDVARSLGLRLRELSVEPGVALVPVPTTRLRRWKRGVDGVRSIAEAIAVERVVEALRIVSSRPQRGKTRPQRIDAQNRFEAETSASGRSIVLVDDVCTTGSTLEDCARALRAVDARVLGAMVVALA